jgi:hypothetical protein|tara:strand:+ start:669 stop:905 length:237 start_codon:yes stop_codon:yes gene_type:complete
MITKTTNVYNSSLVKESVYDFETKQLIVFFPSAEYHYHGVSAGDYNEFANADSQGKALNEIIKGNYEFTKLEKEDVDS